MHRRRGEYAPYCTLGAAWVIAPSHWWLQTMGPTARQAVVLVRPAAMHGRKVSSALVGVLRHFHISLKYKKKIYIKHP